MNYSWSKSKAKAKAKAIFFAKIGQFCESEFVDKNKGYRLPFSCY